MDSNYSLTSVKRALDDAKKWYSKITFVSQKTPRVMVLKKRLDSVEKEFNEKSVAENAAREKRNELFNQKNRYSSSVRKYSKLIYLLSFGKKGDAGTKRFNDLEYLKENLADFKSYEPEFKEKFPLLISEAPDYESTNCPKVRDLLDYFTNADKYRDVLVEVVFQKQMDELVKRFQDNYEGLRKRGRFSASWLSDIYGKDAKKELYLVKNAKPYYKWIGKSVPMDKAKKINSIKQKQKKLLESTARKNSWQKKMSEYPGNTSAMKKVALKVAKRYKMQLVAAGMNNAWRIHKNGLGIPLRKSCNGYLILRKKGEPFSRGYAVSFIREYNGNGYDPVGDIAVGINNSIIPFK